MARTVLQWLGAAFVVATLAAGITALLVVKDRVRIVVEADGDPAAVDENALLRDDVHVLAEDVRGLREAWTANLEQLADALEQRATSRHEDVRALQAKIAALERRLEHLGRGVGDVREAVDRLAAAPAAAVPTATTPVPAEPPAAEPPPAETVVAAETAPPPAAASVPPKSGFLSFSLPATELRFGELQDYVLVPELCRVGFDAKSTLHDFSGVTSKVQGTFRADFDDPKGAWTGEVKVAAATLCTGVDGRDANMRDHLDTEHHAELVFAIERFEPAADGIDAAAQTARGQVVGKLTIRGKTRDFRMPIAVAVDPQRRVVVAGQAPARLSDFDVPVPSQLGVINMQDEVDVWIALRARRTAGARK